MTLEPIQPKTAIDLYLDSRKDELSENTHTSHRRRLKPFARWCDLKEIENLNELSGRDLHNYRLWRREDGDLNNVSLKTQLSTIRVFVKFLESIDAVTPRLHG